MSEADDIDPDGDLPQLPRAGTYVPLRADKRDARVIAAYLTQGDAAEECVVFAGVGRSATRMLLERYPRMTRKHANKLQVAVQLRWQLEAPTAETRPARKNLMRARLEDLYRRALEAKKAMLVFGKGGQTVVYVDEPDLKAAALILGMLLKLDGLDVPELSGGPETPEAAREEARRAFAEAYGLQVLPAKAEGG